MSDIVSSTFSKDVSPNNVTCVFKANKPTDFVPTQSVSRSLEGNCECVDDADANKRVCNGEDKGLDSSSEINLCSKAIIHSKSERSAKKDITNSKLRIKMFSSSSDETDTDVTNVNRRFIVSHKDIIKSDRIENFSNMQIDLPENSTASCESDDAATNVPDQMKKSSDKNGKRVNEKRNKIVQKLRRHKSSKVMEDTNLNTSDSLVKNVPNLSNICDNSDSSEDTNTDDSMIKIKRLKNHGSKRVLVSELVSSDEEDKRVENYHKREKTKRPQNEDSKILSKPTKVNVSKMSAKEAMENRQIIKRESNRMLRDKQVTLPYHRPKPLSLKEIMNRRCPTLMPNGKELPLKMNEEQLKYFALQLQQQQKELIELCKSDSEDEKSPVIPQELDQGANDNKDMLNRFFDNVENGNDDLAGDSRTTMEANQFVSQEKATDSGVDLPLCDFKETETFEVNAEKNNESLETNKLVFVNTAESECGNVANSIASEFNNETNDNCKSTDTGDKKSDYQNMKNIIDSKDNTSADGHHTVACINCEISNHDTEVSSSVVQDSESIHLQYDSEENKIINHDSIDKTIEKCDSNLLSHTEDQLNNSKTKGETHNIEGEYNINNNDDYVNDNSVLFGDISEGIEDFDIDSIVDMANKESDNSVQDISASTFAQDISLSVKPKLRGAPGMIIDLADLDSPNATVSQKISGLELLKQKFQYFAKIKTPDDLEREKEKKLRPGTLHSKLKQELENKIAEQRSLEWSRRLEEEIQNKLETNNMIEDKANNIDDELESIEAKLKDESDFEDKNNSGQESDSEEESEPEDIMCDDVKKKNPLIADEAEESGVDDEYEASGNEDNSDIEKVSQDDNSSDSEESSESSEEDEINETSKRKGRILKAFEDSDDEGNKIQECKDVISESVLPNCDKNLTENAVCNIEHKLNGVEQLQVSHLNKNQSEDLFASQNTDIENNLPITSILNDQTEFYSLNDKNVSHSLQKVDKRVSPSHGQSLQNLPMVCATDTDNEVNLDDVALMCSGTFSQNLVTSQSSTPMTQFSETQKITENDISINEKDTYGSEIVKPQLSPSKVVEALKENNSHESCVKKSSVEENLLRTILDEMDEADLDNQKRNKYFYGHSSSTDKENEKNSINVESKKKLIIESDEEETDVVEVKKRLKRKKREKRVLQISDDEEELSENDSGSETNEDFILDGSPKNVVEYDSEENEVEVLLPQKIKRKARDFLEQEAELTSEDEWMGSGDEDEVGLDRMEREEGDDETFNQMKLRDELGQIHMRDVLDQDKREVRLLQELLLEDGDLGEGHRQRKFRWKNADGEEMTGTVPNEMTDTQEEEFESEELWRKQRHEREIFLRQMKEQDKEIFNSSITRNTIIKANLNSKSLSSLLMELNTTNTIEAESVTKEKKNAVPSPFKEQCPIFQQQPRSSLLSRGKSTLDRLAALATPLAADAEQEPTNMSALAPSRKRNFVFSILTPPTNENKVTKRKATSNAGTPNLMKKMKVNESQKPLKKSLLDQINL